jgi:hypothetical protein
VIFHGLQPTAPGAVPVGTVSVVLSSCMDELTTAPHHGPVRVLPHIMRLDECFGDFPLRLLCWIPDKFAARRKLGGSAYRCGETARSGLGADASGCGFGASPGVAAPRGAHTGRARLQYCMDAPAAAPHHAPVHVLTHIRRLDDALGRFRVRIACKSAGLLANVSQKLSHACAGRPQRSRP